MKPKFDIVRMSRWFFLLSAAITIAGIIVFAVFGFNLSTDFKAGSRVQLQVNQTVGDAKVQQMFDSIGLHVEDANITTQGKDTVVVRFPTILTDAETAKIKTAESSYFPKNQGLSVDTVDPYVANQTAQRAVIAVLVASAFIVIYICIRFEWRFAIAGIIALLHDAFIVLAAFALLRREVDLTFVAAVLTIIGYSINDTIVIFDRIRENLKIVKPKDVDTLKTLVNRSLWQTMSRSINTVITVLIASLILYFFGGTSIRNFTFALIIGLVSGAYSSIFIASPLWLLIRGRNLEHGKKKNESKVNPA
ncbi:protein translocase subunit SecF [Alicyclobacillus fodiniaquatilis]|jgi:SecD/SecF fusion protein|uniref:Protein-export membrane protein SecF n=1 Tax=Alicyclobacillus fodiniaquatilis TaxID=1661150 RepID=A0ABW4JMZ9_9BACL